ncbi:hypoxanthine phosphoribosyltransferase [Sphingobacterium allocomposti]|jgi:hypoxanthine phosphoribosyltransferase|uniref:Hypoxanthine phosphoribosyltransferase n=1 Tax=Sphingobacterium allocomposti TaxID=415956 RepID=A0A5S5D2G0_9SPHI|nr:phosphoribosyltransferase family protein [Sphingobacterium composti Yoo et al. 2007 non Ten et al. 2007]TYP90141.1 hypoxanthine phosphoribosyltransferase [Sphingobacterium composti Yoo et al. 2007 non Ten et al. 2007]HLS95242.1 phosphoribosyltransferase family protein [Sphingobacterium sp.]
MNSIQIDNLNFELFIDYDQIKKRIRLMGIDISLRYADKHPVFVGVLNGCFMFMADLLKQVHVPCEISFVKLASYKGTSQGDLQELFGVGMDLGGRDVIIVEDIIDSGNSLRHTINALERLGVGSIAVCTLLMKPDCLQHHFDNIMYVGFEIDKEFVVGYGLDYNGQCRNLPDIYRHVEST